MVPPSALLTEHARRQAHSDVGAISPSFCFDGSPRSPRLAHQLGACLNGASELFEQILTIVAFVAVCAVWAFAGVAVVVGIARWLWHLIRFAPPQWRGHVATATISGCRKDGERRYVPLVSFVTETGETRTSIPVLGTGYTDPPLPIDKPFVLRQFKDEVLSWRRDDSSARSPAPPIGQTATIVYNSALAQSVSFPITQSLYSGAIVGAVIIALVWLAFSLQWISIALAEWTRGPSLMLVAYTIFGAMGFVLSYTAAASLLGYSRYRRLEQTGYVAPATASFRWNASRVMYEPVLTFVTDAGQSRHKVLGASFPYDRLPRRAPLTMVYDPDDPAFAEVSYTPGSAPRPPINVVIGVCVALFTLLLVPPWLLWGHGFMPLRISVATGLGLGVIAAMARPMLSRMANKASQ
jgi:hypothetical protein